jgi:predicted transcriptional regulator
VIEKALEDYLAVQAWQIAEIKEGIAEADAGRLVPHEKVAAWVDSWSRAKRKRRPRA